MKSRLNELSIAAFIELSCGDTSVLLGEGEETDSAVLEHLRTEMIAEYRSIINPAAMKSFLIEKEDETKLRAKILMFQICERLCFLRDYELARSVMLEYEPGYSLEGESMKKDIEKRLRDSEFMLKRISSSKEPYVPPTEQEIRASFDKELACIMTYFKMPIDTNLTNAAVYANIVNRAMEEMKRKIRG